MIITTTVRVGVIDHAFATMPISLVAIRDVALLSFPRLIKERSLAKL